MLAVDRIVLIIIFLIVLFLVLLLLVIGYPVAQQAILQAELSRCCETYRLNGCPTAPTLMCNGNSITYLVTQLRMDTSDWEPVKRFCNC